MAHTGTLTQAYRAERAQHATNTTSTPLLTHIARFAARHLPAWAAFRAFILTVAGLALLTGAAWQLTHIAGLAFGGVSLLVLEWLLRGGSQ